MYFYPVPAKLAPVVGEGDEIGARGGVILVEQVARYVLYNFHFILCITYNGQSQTFIYLAQITKTVVISGPSPAPAPLRLLPASPARP